MTRRILYFVLLIVVMLALGLAGDLFRGVITASFCHWRHGNSFTIAQYEIPLPKWWFVESVSGNVAQLSRAHFPHLRTPSFEPSRVEGLVYYFQIMGATVINRASWLCVSTGVWKIV